MSADLMPFTYGDAAVRVVMIDSDPWFVLADLTKVLGLSQFRTDRLDDDLIRNHPIEDRLGRTQQATVVNESGMYEVVIRSDKPEAVTFRRWITGTVLPEIRRTGSYNAAPIDGSSITRMELIEIARNAEMERLALEAENKELAPKAEAYDSFLGHDYDEPVDSDMWGEPPLSADELRAVRQLLTETVYSCPRAEGMQRVAGAGEVSADDPTPDPAPSPACADLSDAELLTRAAAAAFKAACYTPLALEIAEMVDLGEALIDRAAQFMAIEDQPFVSTEDLAAHITAIRRCVEDNGYGATAVDDEVARDLTSDYFITKK